MSEEVTRTVTVVNRLGIHARAAAKFVTLASRVDAEIQVRNSRRAVNGKSIMGVLLLVAAQGTEITIHCDGSDAKLCLQALTELVDDKFGED